MPVAGGFGSALIIGVMVGLEKYYLNTTYISSINAASTGLRSGLRISAARARQSSARDFSPMPLRMRLL
ncbi:hypothetical protein MW887_006715 [Aspergillus wentii]|nr:hypothetical protein MW887_006715 [Aspergillus wentii]